MAVSPMPLCVKGGMVETAMLRGATAQILSNRFRQAEFQRIADERVTDRHFHDPRHLFEKRREVMQVEVVASVDFQTDFRGTHGGSGVMISSVRVVFRERSCVG